VFRVVSVLGGGSSAEVFRAVDERDGREVAIKLFPRAGVRAAEFRREAGIAMRNVHPNLVRLVDAGVHGERPYLALEYVDGSNARTLLYTAPPAPPQVLDLLRQCLAGLDAMHRVGLVHGDIKPENVLIQEGRVRLADFGRTRLAHVLLEGRPHAGTPPYMHPSLFSGAPASAATDCFATWVMGYELLSGVRPYERAALHAAATTGALARPPALADPELDRLVQAGLDGRLADARSGWLAITRHLSGRHDLPRLRPPPPPLTPARLAELRDRLEQTRSVAVLGHPDATRPLLEALDRSWRRTGGTVAWLTPGWRQDLPLADALSIAASLAESLDGPQLAAVARELGPLADSLAAAVPATRAWLRAAPTPSTRPEPERLALALGRALAACPPPVLVLTRSFERVDGASRRLLRHLLTTGTILLAAGAPADHPSGLAGQIAALPHREAPVEAEATARLSGAARELLLQARLLDLPFDRILARAVDLSEATVQALAQDLEAAGLARWTGEEIVPGPGPHPHPLPTGDAARAVFARAARRLDARQEPWRVARFALRGEDGPRLAEVIDDAVAAAARRAPVEALELARADPRPQTPQRLLASFRLALQARDMAAAEEILALLRAAPGLCGPDLAEAEGELAFRRGDTLTAIAAYERASRGLGQPIPAGVRGTLHDLRALLQIWRGRLPAARPDPRLARILENLYDLRFSHDQAWLLRLHRLWLRAAPADPRALALEVMWRQLLGRPVLASQLDAQLSEGIHEDTDPIGFAIVLMNRAIGRLLHGEVVRAFSEGVDAASRLARAGDPYQAALASTLATAAAVHVVGVGPLGQVHRALVRLVEDTRDERAARWAAGIDGVLRWQQGNAQGAVEQTRRWAEGAALHQDASEALARRFLAELYLEEGRVEAALAELDRSDAVARAMHIRMDFTEARVLSQLIADGMARQAGHPGLSRRRALLRRATTLVRRSPRWGPRALVAQAVQLAADGQPGPAAACFQAAFQAALDRDQTVDAWWALHHRGRVLDDDQARADALALAHDHHFRQGAGLGPPPAPEPLRP